ncbi:MYND-type domain-containing protein [Mycena kentingensis (nom. inval.)]|nr:MYND-type domain-containing protein [Mycena kentingensis (nom. inval.)]
MLSRQQMLELLSAMGVDLPPKTKLPDAELDKRLTKALDSAQYISRVVPTTPFDPNTLPAWSSSQNGKKERIGEAIKRHNVHEAGIVATSKAAGVEPFPLYANPFQDLRQTMMALGMACDNPHAGSILPLIIQDAEKEVAGIVMRIVDVRMFDGETPVLVVFYRHDVAGSASLMETVAWVQDHVNADRPIHNVTATLSEQEMLLRVLKQNSKRLAKSYRPNRTATESGFTLSFLLPIGPLTAKDMAKLNANNGCTVCGDPAKSKCSRCAVMRYCSAVCQKEDWKAHRTLCKSWETATWHRISFTTRGCRPNGLFISNISRFDIVQHGDIFKNNDIASFSDPSPPQNTHGEMPFIVKVQVLTKDTRGPEELFNTSRDPKVEHLMFYDKNRTLDVLVLRAPETEADYGKMAELVRRQGNPAKGFVWALRSGDWSIDVCMDSFPEPQKW